MGFLSIVRKCAALGLFLAPVSIASLANAQEIPQPTDVAALPRESGAMTGEPKPGSATLPAQAWTVVLIQTALAERGCRDVAISGTWDQGTETAATRLLGGAERAPRITADESLVAAIRAAPGRACLLDEAAVPSAVVPPRGVGRTKRGRPEPAAVVRRAPEPPAPKVVRAPPKAAPAPTRRAAAPPPPPRVVARAPASGGGGGGGGGGRPNVGMPAF